MLWERDGFVIFYKQLQSGTFAALLRHDGDYAHAQTTLQQLTLILAGVDTLPDATAEGVTSAPVEVPARCALVTPRERS